MGLLSRRRRTRATDRADPLSGTGGSGSDQPAVPALAGQPIVTASGGDLSHSGGSIIRAEDLAQPAWTRLPPTPPLLPPMPFVVARTFERDLVSWRAPERSLAPLAHAVSDAGPAGVVEAMVVAPAAGARGTAAGEPSGASGASSDAGGGAGRPDQPDSGPFDPAGPIAPAPGGPAVASAPWPGSSLPDLTLFGAPDESASTGDPTGGSTWFHSTQPTVPSTEAATYLAPGPGAGEATRPVSSPRTDGRAALLRASTPPGMPIVQLPVVAVPGSGRAVPGSGRAAPPVEQPPISPPSPISPGAGPALSVSQPGPAPIDPGPAPIGGDTPSRSLDPSGSGLPGRPSGPPVTAPPTAARPDGEENQSPGSAPPPLPLASPGRPTGPSGEGSRKAGLGAPMAGLPPTAASFDVSSLITTAKGRARIASLAQPSAPRSVTPSAGGGASGLHAGSGPGAAGPGRQSDPGAVGVPARPRPYAGPSWSALPLLPAGSVSDLTVAVPLERLPSAWPAPDGRDLPEFARPLPPDAGIGFTPEPSSRLVTAGPDPSQSTSPSGPEAPLAPGPSPVGQDRPRFIGRENRPGGPGGDAPGAPTGTSGPAGPPGRPQPAGDDHPRTVVAARRRLLGPQPAHHPGAAAGRVGRAGSDRLPSRPDHHWQPGSHH